MKFFFSLFLILQAGTIAQADILFINLNDSAEEIKSAKRALEKINKVHKKNGEPLEELVEVPAPLSKKERRQLDDLGVYIRKANRQVKKDCVNKESKKCSKAQGALKELNEQKQALRDKTKFSEAALREVLAAQVARNRDFRSAIISGHDGTGTFSGINGSLSDVKFGNMVKEFPTLSQGLTTLYAWGCYTANPGAVEGMWKKNFPYLAAVIGYDYKGAKNDAIAGHNYLQVMMENEEKALRAKDATELQALLKTVEGYNIIKPAIAVCELYATPNVATTFAELKKSCAAQMQQLKAAHAIFECYARASEEKCQTPPENTSRSELRDYYELLQTVQICGQLPEYSADFRSMSTDQTIRLIFFRNVMANLQKNYKKELAEVDKALEEVGAPAEVRFSSLSELSRHDLFARIELLNDFLASQEDLAIQPPLKQAQISMLFNFRSAIVSSAVNLGTCVPFNWVEPDAPEDSKCISRTAVGDANVQASLNNPAFLKSNIISVGSNIILGKMEEAQLEVIKNPTDISRAAYEHISATFAWEHSKRPQTYSSNSYEFNDPTIREIRVKRAERLMELAANGTQNIYNDPQVVSMALEYNIRLLETSRNSSTPITKKKIELMRHRLQLENKELDAGMKVSLQAEIKRLDAEMNEIVYQEKIESLRLQEINLATLVQNSKAKFLSTENAAIYEKQREQVAKEIELMRNFKERYSSGLAERMFLRPIDGLF